MVDVVDAATRLVSARYPDNTLYISLANADCNSGLLKNTFLNDFMPNFTSGHEFPFVSLPIGAMVELDSDRLEIKICEEIYE